MDPFGGLVVGASDVDATIGFFGTFGFVVTARSADGAVLRMPDGAPVDVVVEASDAATAAPCDYQLGPRALDLYTTDIDDGLAVCRDAGWSTSGVGVVSMGPVTMRQALVVGPDGMPVVLVESTHRRSSLLDVHPDRRFSEPHSVVWAVADLDAEAARWVAAGATRGMDLRFVEPAVSEYLGLPDSPVEIRMTMLADADVSPLRLELLEYVGRTHAEAAGGPIVALLHDREAGGAVLTRRR